MNYFEYYLDRITFAVTFALPNKKGIVLKKNFTKIESKKSKYFLNFLKLDLVNKIGSVTFALR